MLRLNQERAAWELKNETNKINVRWFLMLVITSYLGYVLESGQAQKIGNTRILTWYFILAILAGMSVLNLIFFLYTLRVRMKGTEVSRVLKYITMTTDLVAVSLLVTATQGSQSNFFVVYFIVMVSNGLRYGMRMSLFGVLVFNMCYVGVLVFEFQGRLDDVPGRQTEVLKVAGVWLVGLYVGYLARRFEMLRGEVEKYQRLVEELMARKDA